MRNRLQPRQQRKRKPRGFPFKQPLLAALAACSIISCDSQLPERGPKPKIPPVTMSAPAEEPDVGKPMKRPAMKPAMEPMKKPDAMKQPEVKKAPKPKPQKASCGHFCSLTPEKYGEAAVILQKRTTQKRKKMKLTFEEGELAAGYLVKWLPYLPKSSALIKKMPKTTIELVRSINERGVKKKDAEEMADYLLRFLKSMKIMNKGMFDECISHMIGREWHQIDYSGEGMTWQGQRRFYNRRSRRRLDWVKNIKKAVYLHRFFQIERKLRYFRKMFAPQGQLPDLEQGS